MCLPENINKRRFHLEGIQIPVLQFKTLSILVGKYMDYFSWSVRWGEVRKSNSSDNHLKALRDPLGWVVTGVVAWCRDTLHPRWSVSTLQAVARICIVSLIHRNLGQTYTMQSPPPQLAASNWHTFLSRNTANQSAAFIFLRMFARNVHQSPCFFHFTRWYLFSFITKWQILKKHSNLAVSKFGFMGF